MDALGLRGDRRQHDLGRRDGEVVAVVLADAEEVEAHLIGQHALGHDVPQHLGLRQPVAVRVHRDVAEGVDSELDLLCHEGS